MAFLSQDIAPIAGGDFIKYKFVMAVIDRRNNYPRCFVTLENSPVASNVLCVFETNGSHSNCGSLAGPNLMQEFIVRAKELLQERFNLSFEELKKSSETTEQDRSAGRQGPAGRGRPSDYELESRVATTIDGFIESGGLAEFASTRMHVVIEKDFRVAISEPRLAKNALVSVPLSDLILPLELVREGGSVRHIAVDLAAKSVVARLSP
jgi:hypothetical protein